MGGRVRNRWRGKRQGDESMRRTPSRGEIKEKMKPVDQVNTCKIYIYVTCVSNTDL